MKRASTFALLILGTAVCGCKPDAALRKGEIVDRGTTTLNQPNPSAPQNAGAISGTVRFTGKAPERLPIDMSMDPACSMSAGQNLSEQYVLKNGKLANVFVYVKSGIDPSNAPAGSSSVVVNQQGCRYVPHVIAVQQGGSVEFRNSDPTMHNIHTMPTSAGNDTVDISQGPMGAAQTRQFNSPELMMPIRCNNHPWMQAFLNVAPNPYFAVTGADGTFSIPNLPPGTYTLAAVQEKLGERDMQITITQRSTSKAEFVFAAK